MPGQARQRRRSSARRPSRWSAKIKDRLATAEADLARIAAALAALPSDDRRALSDVTHEVERRAGRRAASPGWSSTCSRSEALLDLLGSPQRAYPAIHLTGTNGKTSTARMIDSLLRAHGLHTGRYTSPHLETVRERISLDGEPVSRGAVRRDLRRGGAAGRADRRRGPTEPLTYFDMTTAMAFAAFADAPVDVAVVEVGLGGAEDATNVHRRPASA